MLSCEGKLRKLHTFQFLSCLQMRTRLHFSLGCVRRTLQDDTGVHKLKEQLLYLKFAALTAGWVTRFEAFPVLSPLHTSTF